VNNGGIGKRREGVSLGFFRVWRESNEVGEGKN
jgi:hypothetical protein